MDKLDFIDAVCQRCAELGSFEQAFKEVSRTGLQFIDFGNTENLGIYNIDGTRKNAETKAPARNGEGCR